MECQETRNAERNDETKSRESSNSPVLPEDGDTGVGGTQIDTDSSDHDELDERMR